MSDRIVTEWAIEVSDNEDFDESNIISSGTSRSFAEQRLNDIRTQIDEEFQDSTQHFRLVTRVVQYGSWEVIGG